MIGGQVMIVYVGGQAFGVTRISGILWAVCLICALGCLPWAVVLRILPDRHFGIVFNAVVSGMNFILRPLSKGFKALVRGAKALFRPLSRFTRRANFRRNSQTTDTPLASSETPNSPVMDEEAPASTKLARLESHERPRTPPTIVVPPITVTTSP
ncbi:hypothetical protein N7526_003541 [Penicillium atrosanguineum]|nr:hypothetical protein N7526_003541 [Penicillium atrosanguineum]